MRAQGLLRRLPAALALAIALAATPVATRAVEAIPSFQTGIPLASDTITAIVGDVDGDGVRELVRITPAPNSPSRLVIDVVTIDGKGQPVVHASTPVLTLSPGDGPQDGGPITASQAAIAQPARLMAWRVGGEERVLVAVTGGAGPDRQRCCLAIWQVLLTPDGQSTVRLLANVLRGADHVRVVDLDGDGTDEVVTYEARISSSAQGFPEVEVLRWSGEAFTSLHATAHIEAGGPLVPLGDSDGQPGDELGVTSGLGICRIALGPGGALRLDYADLPFVGRLVPFGGPDGGQLVLASVTDGATLLSWPAEQGGVRVDATSTRRGVPLATLGTGEEARVVIIRNRGDVLDLLGPQLRSHSTGIGGNVAGAIFSQSGMLPYIGTIPGGLPDGEPAVVFQGRLVTRVIPGSDPPLVEGRPIASMPNVVPVGFFGAGSRWAAVAAADSLDIPVAFDAAREGGQLLEPAGALADISLAVVDGDTLLSAEADDGRLNPQLAGAVLDARLTGPRTVSARGTFIVQVTAPAFTRGLLRADAGGTTFSVLGVPHPVEVGPSEGDDRLRVRLLVVTPSGHAYGVEWGVRFLTRAPALSAGVPFASLSFDVPLSGRTDPGASVQVDGIPVEVERDGSFASPVAAGVMPRDVVVEAVDVVGNRASRTLSVVGFVDYRQLPWIPIIVLLMVVAVAVLYLRAPVPRRLPAGAAGDDATLEEID